MVVGYWLLVVGYWLLVVGYWLFLVRVPLRLSAARGRTSYWLLVISYWLLVISYWLLVIGCWLLVVGRGNPAPTSRLPTAYSKAAYCPLPLMSPTDRANLRGYDSDRPKLRAWGRERRN